MNALANESNVQSSLKKYFVDTFGTNVTFDVSLAAPDIRKQGAGAITQWYNVSFGQFGRQVLSDYAFEVFCLSRQDAEGIKLATMSDALMSILVDSSKSDGARRIPLYDASKTPWELIGAMMVQEISDDAPYTIAGLNEDETKMKIFLVRLRWGTVI
jgi:hypothetical protein